MNKTQLQHYYSERKKIADRDRAFLEMVSDPINPMTRDDLIQLVKRHPDRYKRYEGYIDSTMFKTVKP